MHHETMMLGLLCAGVARRLSLVFQSSRAASQTVFLQREQHMPGHKLGNPRDQEHLALAQTQHRIFQAAADHQRTVVDKPS